MANQVVKYTITGENLLSKVLKQVDADAQKAENSVKKVSKATTDSGGSGGGMLGSIVGGNLIASGISKVSGALIGFGKSVVDSLVNYEYFSASLKTMMKGDVGMAEALQGQLVSLAKTTPFSLVDVQQGTKQLMAYGFASGEIISTMKTLGDVSAGVGKPLTEVAYLYGTLKTQGRAFGKDINQFTSAGIPIVKELAKQFKVTESKVMDLVTAGKVGFPEVEKAFKSMTAEGAIFFNLMEDQSKTVGGKISALGDVWEQVKVNIGKSQHGIIASTTDFITNFVGQINSTLSAENFLSESTKGKNRKNGYGQDNSNDVGYASMLEDKLQKKTGNNKDLGETARFISGELQYLQRQKDIFDNKSTYTNEVGKDKGQLKYLDNGKNKLSKDLAVSDNPLDFLMLLQDKRDMLINANKSLMGSARLLNSKGTSTTAGEEDDKGGKGGKAERLGTGVTIESQAPKNQYITINGGLVHEMTIESMDGGTPATQIKEQISTVLVELLNDSYQALR